jgi:hypothetical protein
MTQPTATNVTPILKLTLEEEILSAAGLLDLEVEEGAGPLSAEQRKELLTLAREDMLEVAGRVKRIDFAGQQVWRLGEDLPIDKASKIEGMFGSAREDLPLEYILGDIRVYTAPKQSLPGDSFKRITVNRATPNVVDEPMTRAAFIAAVSEEITHLLELEDADDTIECPACEEDNDLENIFCAACGVKLPEEEEEEEEEETPAKEPEHLS